PAMKSPTVVSAKRARIDGALRKPRRSRVARIGDNSRAAMTEASVGAESAGVRVKTENPQINTAARNPSFSASRLRCGSDHVFMDLRQLPRAAQKRHSFGGFNQASPEHGCQVEGDLRPHLRFSLEDVLEVGLEESDQDRSLEGHRGRRTDVLRIHQGK